MKTYPSLYGRIVTLTRPQKQDYVALGKIFHDQKNMAQVDVYRNPTPEELEKIWQLHNTAINEQKAVRFTITHNKNNQVIGCCGFGSINLEQHCANYGIILDHHYWHTGIYEECTLLSCNLGFNNLGLETIEITTKKDRGVRYIKKMGFILKEMKESTQVSDNIFHDVCTYSINKKRWDTLKRLLTK